MGSGLSKKKQTSDESADKSHGNKNLTKNVTTEKPLSAEVKSEPIVEESLDVKASNKRLPFDVDHWQEVNLAKLMGGLELKDDPYVWQNYVDSLVTKTDTEIHPETERKRWKTVRLFVSSTFKDMTNERDYLVKVVFPQLRQWCEERKLKLVECDLRWGVPKDADTRETLMTCLSEIDRCREENTYPYFLNLMSERYGWVPKIEEVPEDIRARYKWMPGMSVTTSEIMVGGYWQKNKNALFLFRTPDYLDHVKDEKIKSYLVEKDETYHTNLSVLKDKIRANFPRQVYDYQCTYEGESDGQICLTGFEEMGQRVLKHFKTMLELQYPADSLGIAPSLKDILKMEHETFMVQRSQVLLGRDDDVATMMNYINGDVHVPMVLVGYPGSGKSALIAYTIKQSLNNKKYKVFYHFIGATPGSTDLFQILQRFFLEFMPEGTKMPEDLQEMKRYAHTMFEYAANIALKEGFEKIIIFLDALNQMDDEGDAQYLVWLPKKLPEGMRIIVSTLEGKCLNALRGDTNDKDDQKKSVELSVNPLDIIIRKNIVSKILGEYNKRLDNEQLEILTNKPDAGKPLWLTIACEELRVFGDFRKLTQKIKALPEDMIGLLEMVLERIVKEYGKELVQATLCLVETSRFGLLETELLELLAMQPIVPGAKMVEGLAFEGKLPMAKWALVYVGLRQFLRPCGSSGEGRLDFHHRTISKAVRKMYLTDKQDQIWWHKRLTQYFENCMDLERKCEELPYHLECSDDKEKLKLTLVSQDMFQQMYQENTKQQLMKYWRFIGGYQIASHAYYDALKKLKVEKNLMNIVDWAPIQSKTAAFLVDIGEYQVAEDMLNEVIQPLINEKGDEAKELSEPLYIMVNLLYKKALQYVYGSHPGYGECLAKGDNYSELCVKVNEKYFADDKQYFGRILLACGYFQQGTVYLEKALNMFESINDQQGLAVALYMLGEKNQYHQDLNVPINMFTKSLALCLSMFGKFHPNTARCAQLYGQMYWNKWVYTRRDDFLKSCLDMYQTELEILCEVQGDLHPNTVRSREDVIIILQSLGREKEAETYQSQQPQDHTAL